MKNRPQKSVPIFEVDFWSRLSTPISDCVSSALGLGLVVVLGTGVVAFRLIAFRLISFRLIAPPVGSTAEPQPKSN